MAPTEADGSVDWKDRQFNVLVGRAAKYRRRAARVAGGHFVWVCEVCMEVEGSVGRVSVLSIKLTGYACMGAPFRKNRCAQSPDKTCERPGGPGDTIGKSCPHIFFPVKSP